MSFHYLKLVMHIVIINSFKEKILLMNLSKSKCQLNVNRIIKLAIKSIELIKQLKIIEEKN